MESLLALPRLALTRSTGINHPSTRQRESRRTREGMAEVEVSSGKRVQPLSSSIISFPSQSVNYMNPHRSDDFGCVEDHHLPLGMVQKSPAQSKRTNPKLDQTHNLDQNNPKPSSIKKSNFNGKKKGSLTRQVPRPTRSISPFFFFFRHPLTQPPRVELHQPHSSSPPSVESGCPREGEMMMKPEVTYLALAPVLTMPLQCPYNAPSPNPKPI